MIARLRVLLPFALSVPHGDELKPHEFSLGEYRVKVYPPCQAAINLADTEAVSPVPVRDLLEQLRPAEPQDVFDSIRIDGVPTIQANLLQIDFLKADFDRRRLTASRPEDFETIGDPPLRLAFWLANSIVTRIRLLTRGSQVKTLSPEKTFWRLDYLNDDEGKLPYSPEFARRRLGAFGTWRVTALTSTIWNKVQALPADFKAPTWDNLLLDAEALLPDVGASIVLAYAALETFIAWALDQLASLARMPPDLWKWINARDRRDKEPSVTEQFDQLLRIFTNKSLKGENELWEAYRNLREARHSFVHEGKCVVGGEEITPQRATMLLQGAKAIIDWVERLLPHQLHRPKLERGVLFTLQKQVGPATPGANV